METSNPRPVVITGSEVEALPSKRLSHTAGVTHRVLWESGASMAGVMDVEAGHRLGRHAHRANHHHIWVLSGRATILDVEVGPGSYVHVPAGVTHDIDATATDGCSVFYLYERGSAR